VLAAILSQLVESKEEEKRDREEAKRGRKKARKETALESLMKVATTLGGGGTRDPIQFVALLEESARDEKLTREKEFVLQSTCRC
jgi:hypothetical protein